MSSTGTVAQTQAPGAITMPGARRYDYDDDRPHSAQQNDQDRDSPKPGTKKQESKTKEEGGKGEAKGGKGGGWLGGILNKLSLRAPNQMILPDDKNPSVSLRHPPTLM